MNRRPYDLEIKITYEEECRHCSALYMKVKQNS